MKPTLVIPIYNLHGARIRNLLSSISLQTVEAETILVDYGSENEGHLKLVETVEPYDVELIYVPDVEWSVPRACNIGIRKAGGEVIIKVDADNILEPHTLEDTLEYVTKHSFVIRQPKFIRKGFPMENLKLPQDYPKIREAKYDYWLPSYGGFFAVHRDWWHKVHGYDERYIWYGCNDWDIWNRAVRSGLKRYIFGEPGLKDMKGISPYKQDTFVYHQWHPLPPERLGISEEFFEQYREKNRQIYNGASSIVRNTETWGLIK